MDKIHRITRIGTATYRLVYHPLPRPVKHRLLRVPCIIC